MATTKELAPFSSVQDETIVSQNVGGQALSRSDAIGIEIPVVVHASRYSADLGKALPPLHEKTHTAIVFPKGAILRLAANLSAGELVVLTNQQSGADVLCRVSSVKTHPGSQNYIGLEFTQCAPEFWAPCFVAQLPSLAEEPSSKPHLPIAATSFGSTPPIQQPASRFPSKAEPASPVSAVPPDAAFAAIPVNGLSVQAPEKCHVEVEAVAPPSSTNGLDATPGLARSGDAGQQLAANSQGPMLSPTLKKGLWVLASAVVVVALTIGGFLVGRRGQFSSPVPELVVTSPTASMQPSAVTPALPQSIEPAAASASSTVLSATSPQQPAPLEGVQNEYGSSSQQSSRRSDVGKLLRPPLRNPTAKIASSEPPQMPLTPRDSFTENALGTGALAGSRADVPAQPTSATAPSSAAHANTQLQPPQLIYSPPLVYPVYARQANIEGIVVVDALVDGTGKVADANVVSGPLPLQQAALETVHAFKYQPARLDGRPVAEHMKVNLDFALSPPPASASPELKTQPTLTQSISVIAPMSPAANEAPKAISSQPPIYPAVARAENIEGTVVVDILVDATGKVTQTKAISGPVQLQPAAVDAVRYWKYQPARKDGQSVAQRMQVSINFRLH